MEIILWIVGGFIALVIAYVLLKLAAAFLGLSVLLGGITWLIFDSFWIGAGIGLAITIIRFISDPGEFLDSAMESHSGNGGSSSSSSSSTSSQRYFMDNHGCRHDIRYEDATSVTDQYGDKYQKDINGNIIC